VDAGVRHDAAELLAAAAQHGDGCSGGGERLKVAGERRRMGSARGERERARRLVENGGNG
jgi:hypothetical protein